MILRLVQTIVQQIFFFSSREGLLHTERFEMQKLKALIELESLSTEKNVKLQRTEASMTLVVCLFIIVCLSVSIFIFLSTAHIFISIDQNSHC